MEELRGKASSDLRTARDTTREELFKMRIVATTEPVDNPFKIQQARRRIARIETILRQRELEEAAKNPNAAAPAGKK